MAALASSQWRSSPLTSTWSRKPGARCGNATLSGKARGRAALAWIALPPGSGRFWNASRRRPLLPSRNSPLPGLTDEEAATRLRDEHAAPSAAPKGPAYRTIVARQLLEPLAGLLVVAVVVSLAIGEALDGVVIAAIVVLNAVLGFVQEAERRTSCARAAGGRSPARHRAPVGSRSGGAGE